MSRSLESALLDFGIDPLGVDLDLFEVWQRLPTTSKPKKRNAAVLVRSDDAVIIMDWSTGERTVWLPDRGSAAVPLSRRRETARNPSRANVEGTRRRQADAAAVAERVWADARQRLATKDHPYLQRKKLPPLDLRETSSINGWRERWLICPLYSSEPLEQIRNLECINTHEDKRPIKGALRRSVYGFAGPGTPTDQVIICEGWATAPGPGFATAARRA